MAGAAEAALGPLDVVVANGGIASRPSLIADLPVEAGVNALTLTLANEVAPRGIRVNAIAPGLVMTDMGERMLKWRSTTPSSPAAARPGSRVRPSASPEYWRNTSALLAPPTSAPSPTPALSTGRSSSAPAAVPVESRTRIP
jgi:NAD(P)-dependent dehydrogenase (short-subunit alcohol dehydrogenase family)